MTLHVLEDLIQGTDEWHAQRRGIVTASVVGRLITTRTVSAIDFDCTECGAAPNLPCLSKKLPGAAMKTLHQGRAAAVKDDDTPPELVVSRGDDARSLTAQLVAERITNWTDPTYVSDDMLRGTEDEPRAVDVYSEHYGPVTTVGFMVEDTWGFKIGYSPDGLVGDDGLIEVKSRRPKKQLQTILADEVPPENMAQLQCGLLVSGREWIDYVSYCGGMPLYRKRVHLDLSWSLAIVEAVSEFEEAAARMTDTYQRAVEGLPVTERVTEMEMTF